MRLPPPVGRLAAAVKSRLSDAALRTAVEMASLAVGPAVLGLPAFRRVLVLAPHPDDETIGCGGTIALLAGRGAMVQVVVATDGESTIGAAQPPQVVAGRRRREAVAACRALGAAPPIALGLPDGRLQAFRLVLDEMLTELATSMRPELIMAPWALDGHPDHRAAAAAAARVALELGCELWGYEAHTPLPADRAVDITAAIDRKRDALGCHVTAAGALDLDATLGLNRWRSLLTAAGSGWAECFATLPITVDEHDEVEP